MALSENFAIVNVKMSVAKNMPYLLLHEVRNFYFHELNLCMEMNYQTSFRHFL